MTLHLGHLTNGAFSLFFEQGAERVSFKPSLVGGEVITQEKPHIRVDALVTKDAPDTSQPLKVIVESVHD